MSAVSIEEHLARLKRKRDAPSEILPHLLLGSGRAASDAEGLLGAGVTHILNVADDVPNFHPARFIYGNLQVGDFGSDAGISRVFPQALQFVREAQSADAAARVLVHCAAGSNRSVTVVVALLMAAEGKTLRQAFEVVCRRHGRACPLKDNRAELMRFELETTGRSTLTDGEFRTVARQLASSERRSDRW